MMLGVKTSSVINAYLVKCLIFGVVTRKNTALPAPALKITTFVLHQQRHQESIVCQRVTANFNRGANFLSHFHRHRKIFSELWLSFSAQTQSSLTSFELESPAVSMAAASRPALVIARARAPVCGGTLFLRRSVNSSPWFGTARRTNKATCSFCSRRR
jgi:hypothetical protein